MRRFFIFMFIAIPILVLGYSFWSLQAELNDVDGNPVAFAMNQPRATIDPDVSQRMTEVFAKAEESIGIANNKGNQFSDYAHKAGWLGAICSWLIIGVTVFLKNAYSAAPDEEPKAKMPLKSIATAVLAVVAAVSPLASEKLTTDSEQFIKKASSLREQKSDARTAVFANELPKEKLLAFLDELMDAARR